MMAVKDMPLNAALPQVFAGGRLCNRDTTLLNKCPHSQPQVVQNSSKDGARIPKQTTVRRRVIFPTIKREPLSSQYIQEPIKLDEIPIEVTPEKSSTPPPGFKPMDEQTKEEAHQKLGALLVLSPLVPGKPAVEVEVRNEKPAPFILRPIPPRPPVASLGVQAMEEEDMKEEGIPHIITPNRPRRSILALNMSISEQEAPRRNRLTTPLVSILRTKKSRSELSLDAVGSVPSLVSLKDEGEDSSQSSVEAAPAFSEKYSQPVRPSVSDSPQLCCVKSISFDPRIWVQEFERTQEEHESTWYSNEDMQRFKRHALALIMARQHTDFIATGTGRMVQRTTSKSRAIFTLSALTLDGPDDATEALRTDKYRCAVVQNEIRNVLLVDPHDICLALFTKAMKALLPLANVSRARSSQEALEHMSSGKRFDIILVEERLKLFHGQSNNKKERCSSGSELIRTLISLGATHALFVGVSAHLDRDRDALERGGADCCWPKPPPLMDQGLRNHLLKSLLLKRGRATVAEELFG